MICFREDKTSVDMNIAGAIILMFSLVHLNDVVAKTSTSMTPLMLAARTGNLPVVAYLLKIGADVRAQDSSYGICIVCSVVLLSDWSRVG